MSKRRGRRRSGLCPKRRMGHIHGAAEAEICFTAPLPNLPRWPFAKAAQGGGVYSAWKKRSDCPQGWGLSLYLRLSTMSERRGRRRASIEGTPSIGPIQRSFRSRNTRPRPVKMSTQSQHLLQHLQHRHPKHSCTWSSMIPPISLLLMSGYSHMRPSRVKILTRLVSVPKPASLAETSLATMKSRFFF